MHKIRNQIAEKYEIECYERTPKCPSLTLTGLERVILGRKYDTCSVPPKFDQQINNKACIPMWDGLKKINFIVPPSPSRENN